MSFNPLEHMKVLTEEVRGFFRGVVRDADDPKKLGRVRVEVLPVMKGIDIEYLPWAEKAMSFIPPVNSLVWVFFEQLEIYKPVYFAVAAPVLIEEDLAPIAEGRGYPLVVGYEAGKTYQDMVAMQKESVAVSESLNANKVTENEPDVSGDHTYPQSKIHRFTSGVIIEVLDKSGGAVINVYHPSGSFIEISNEKIHVRSSGETYLYSDKPIKVHSTGQITINSIDNVHINPVELVE